MGVIIYSPNLNISPKMSCGVLECGVYSVTEFHAYAFVVKDFKIERGRYLCRSLYLQHDGHRVALSCSVHSVTPPGGESEAW